MAEAPRGVKDGWAARAEAFGRWAWERLANRMDCWGYYLPPWRRQPGETFGRTAPRVCDRGKVLLTPAHLSRHAAGRSVADVIGLHSTSPDNTSRWGAIDIDRHDGGRADPARNLAAALAWYDRLKLLGITPLLTDSGGAGGYHLLALFSEPVPTARVFAFLQWLTRDHAAHGLAVRPETFPRQPAIRPGGCGNWLRLPGRHHTRDHWSRVWDGTAWLVGAPAVDFMVSLQGAPPSLIPAEVMAFAPRPAAPARPPAQRPVRRCKGGLVGRIQAYLDKLPHRSAGEGRDNVAFVAACWLVRDLRLTDSAALAWLLRWDQGNSPPKGEQRLREILSAAHKYGTSAYGSGLSHAEAFTWNRTPS